MIKFITNHIFSSQLKYLMISYVILQFREPTFVDDTISFNLAPESLNLTYFHLNDCNFYFNEKHV